MVFFVCCVFSSLVPPAGPSLFFSSSRTPRYKKKRVSCFKKKKRYHKIPFPLLFLKKEKSNIFYSKKTEKFFIFLSLSVIAILPLLPLQQQPALDVVRVRELVKNSSSRDLVRAVVARLFSVDSSS